MNTQPTASMPTILIVDDAPENLRLLADILRNHGYLTRLLREGQMVLSAVLHSPPQLILLDIMMPEMDGYEVCQQLKADERTREIPVIFLSALNETTDKVKAFAAGGVDYITKPFQADEVLARVQTHLALHELQRQLEKQNIQLHQEILHRQQAEQLLAEERNLLRTLIDHIPDYIYAKDSDCRFILNNQAHLGILGATQQDEVLGQTDFDRFPKELAEQYYADEQQILQFGEGFLNKEELLFAPNGEQRWMLVSKVPFRNPAGNVTGIVGISHDITERKQMEEALRELNASKDKFFSIIAHDLRSPFTALMGLTEIMAENLQRFTTEQLQYNLEKLYGSAKNVYSLLENLLTWSRIQRGVMEFTPVLFSLADLVENTLFLLESVAEQKQISLCHRIPGDVVVHADHAMIETVLRNLVSNALKFTKTDGTVEVSARQMDELIAVAVTDTGIGMSADELAKLFRIDMKTSKPGTQGERGTGLGLILCKELIAKNGGTLTVESCVGKGTTFTFTLRCSEAA